MKLLMTPTSPYARKARILVLEKNLDCEMCPVAVWDDDPQVLAANPLRKVPVLILDDGAAAADSRVICEYLDSLSESPRFYPADSAARLATKTREAIIEGAMDSALALIMAGKVAPEMTKSDAAAAWKKWLFGKAERTLDQAERLFGENHGGGDLDIPLDMSAVAFFCFLDFWLFRMPMTGWDDWRESRPQLAAWFARVGGRESFAATDPRNT